MNSGRSMYPECFHLLVAAGNDNLRRALLHSLAPAGYRLEEVRGESEAINILRRRRFDLVLLGFNVPQPGGPEPGGIEACRQLRALEPRLRIVMVQETDRPKDEQLALDAGADDCIAAPFRFREIVARLTAVLRRTPLRRGPRAAILRAGNLEADPERRRLRRAGREVKLSPREFDMLLFFMSNPETTFTHVKLLRAVQVINDGHGAETVRPYINGLRRKIENDPAKPEYILTEPWVGYRFHNPGRWR
jgi:two-component system, OmpR family, KDP operon response regulator KdpE